LEKVKLFLFLSTGIYFKQLQYYEIPDETALCSFFIFHDDIFGTLAADICSVTNKKKTASGT
jgi:hypothetical protein